MKIKLTPTIRIQIIALQVIIAILIPVWFLKVNHFFFFPMNAIFSSPSLVPTQEKPQLKSWDDIDYFKTAVNCFWLLLFWVPHIVMATLAWKKFMINIWSNYLFFDRLIFNISSSVLLYYVLDIQEPQNYVLFTIPMYVTVPLTIVGFYFYVDSNIQLKENIFIPYPFKAVMQEKQLQKADIDTKETSGIYTGGSYQWVRHPMQAGLLFLFFFGSGVFTFQKCVILTVELALVYIGVRYEQKRLKQKFSQYIQYMNKVKSRFIPFIF